MTSTLSLEQPACAAPIRNGLRRRVRRRRIAIATLLILVACLMVAMVMLGNTIYPLSSVLRVLQGETVPGASFTVGTLRLPRMITGVLAGMAFGVAGTTFQTMLRNPLASPDVIGITSGASAAAVLCLVVLHWGAAATTAVSLLAGVGVAASIYFASRGKDSTGGRFILIGIGVGAMLTAVISYLIQRAAEWDVAVAMRWLTGSLNGSRWDNILPLAIAVLILIPLVLILSRDLRVLELGDESATALGVKVERIRLCLIVSAVALACFATATTGPIAFVAFLAGPIAGKIVGPGSSTVIPAALTGAALVLAADLIGQYAFDVSFPVGVITGILGAPYLIYLLVRTNRIGGSS